MTAANTDEPRLIQTRCCIAGGGPAGMMAGFLLARAGVEVVVLEKHADFLRDFRGDTIHPSTLQVMYELGILDDLLRRPHQEVRVLTAVACNDQVPIADFSHLPTRCKFIAFMPQWDFLDFLAEHGRSYSTFHLKMNAEVVGLLQEEGRIIGVRTTSPDGPMDVLWMRLSRRPDDPDRPLGRFEKGKMFVMLYRGDYWQCGFVIPKGANEEVRRRGIEAFRESIVEVAPLLHDRVQELRDWSDVKLLTVAVDRLRQWYRPGLLCIGDAAHAMSPVGGVGINLAIQDAVAATNILAKPLREGVVSTDHLRAVQRRRELPTKVTQGMQILVQKRVIGRVLGGSGWTSLPWPLKLLRRYPFLRRIPARLFGYGVRPEHVRTPDAFATVDQLQPSR
jgi:2-polyprenyl-6-methoxyphenol hydroxylase-like FAD-dependent oxidoreductase